MSLRHIAAAAALTASLLGTPARPVLAADLAAHRAVYDLKLDTAHETKVTAATGSMTYEMQDTCDGWATQQRLDMTITNSEGQDVHMLSDYTTYESKDGLRLRFRMKQTTDDAVTSDLAGDATLEPGGGIGSAHFTMPKDDTLSLPKGTLFPTRHTENLLQAAESGRKFIAVPLFDGTTEKGAQDSSIVVNGWPSADKSSWPDLAKLPSGRFHIAFFDRTHGASTPDYEVSMRYWENGVADDLAMDFGDFVMDGNIREFKLLAHGC